MEREVEQLVRFVLHQADKSACPLRIDQFRYIKIQLKTIDLSTRLWGIILTTSVFLPQSLVLRSIVLSKLVYSPVVFKKGLKGAFLPAVSKVDVKQNNITEQK